MCVTRHKCRQTYGASGAHVLTHLSSARQAGTSYPEPETLFLEGMMVTGLSHIFLLVSRLGRSVHFYREFLGRPPASEDASHARFELGPISLTIHEDLTPAEASIWRVDPVPERRGWGVYLTFPTEDLEETYRRLASAGAEILTTPNVTPWGTRMFTAKDPDGYLLELCQRE